MTEPSSPPGAPGPFPVFRMAFAVLGSLLFGASTLVGLATLLAGDYTTTLRCERSSGACSLQFRSSTKQIPLANLSAVERRRDSNGRSRSPSQGLHAIYASGQVDFLCAVPDTSEGAAHLDALAAEAAAFLGDPQQPALDLRCHGKVASVADGLLMTSLSLILTAASFLTLVRGVRQMLGSRSS
jgi:hypothetical protein